MADITLSTDLTAFIPNYWDTVLGENLYPNLYLYQFGTKRTIPRNFGKSIKIPRLRSQNIVGTVSEGTIINTSPISDQFISGTLTQFGGAYKHSDILIFTALSDVIELSLRDIARDIARRMDTHIRDQLSGTGTVVVGSSAATRGNSELAKQNWVFRTRDIIEGVVRLDNQDNPRPPDNHYPLVLHPVTVFDLQTNLSGGAWLDVTKYQEVGIGRTYIGEVGRLYGARIVTSTNVRTNLTLSAGNSGVQEYMFAPDAYYVTEISDLTARTYVHQLGSAGTADPINQQATVGAKVFFTAIPASWDTNETRMIRFKHGTTIFPG